MEASTQVMGKILERPRMNSRPLALENLRLTAGAITYSLDESESYAFGKDVQHLVRFRDPLKPQFHRAKTQVIRRLGLWRLTLVRQEGPRAESRCTKLHKHIRCTNVAHVLHKRYTRDIILY